MINMIATPPPMVEEHANTSISHGRGDGGLNIVPMGRIQRIMRGKHERRNTDLSIRSLLWIEQ